MIRLGASSAFSMLSGDFMARRMERCGGLFSVACTKVIS